MEEWLKEALEQTKIEFEQLKQFIKEDTNGHKTNS